MTLPRPDATQTRAVSQALIRHMNDARRALRAFDQDAYAAAMGEARVCQSWLDVYVNNRKDAA
jgi:hypothetical protein